MVERKSRMQSVNLRSIALPAEHGAWSFLLEPLVLGLLFAPSWSGIVFAVALFFGFLTHQPLKIYVKDFLRNRTTRRTKPALYFAVGYGLPAFLLGVIVLRAAPILLWRALLLIAPFVLIQLLYDFKNKSRELVPELSGAIALSGVVALITILGKVSWQTSLVLWLLVGIRAVVSIHFVRTMLRKQRRKFAPIKMTYALHSVAVILVSVLAIVGIVSYLIIIPFVILLYRAWHSLERSDVVKPQSIGMREVGYGAITIICIILGFSSGV